MKGITEEYKTKSGPSPNFKLPDRAAFFSFSHKQPHSPFIYFEELNWKFKNAFSPPIYFHQ